MDQRLEPTLVYLATLKGLSEAEAKRRLPTWLERMDLADHRSKKISELSKGMQQKAQLIATLLHEPELVVLDEPFSGLDPVNTRLVKDILAELTRSGCTIIMSTHQMFQVEALCHRIALIDRGSTGALRCVSTTSSAALPATPSSSTVRESSRQCPVSGRRGARRRLAPFACTRDGPPVGLPRIGRAAGGEDRAL